MTTINRAYKFRIYPNLHQQRQFYKEFAAGKIVYNYYLNKSIEQYKLDKKGLNFYDWCHDLTELKKQEKYIWLKEVASQCLIQTLRDLDSAYKNFFRNIKQGRKSGFPKFKSFNSSVRYHNQSCEYIQSEHKIQLSKIGKVRIIDYKPAYGRLMNITISKSKDEKWYASICVEQQEKEYINNSQEAVGIDVGIKSFLVDSNGTEIDNPKYLEKSEKKLVRLQRSLSRKKRGSNNRKEAKLLLAKQHNKVAEQRKDFLNKLSTKYTKENKIIVHEDLNIKGMQKNHHLAKSISSVAWGEFFRQLDYKSNWYNSSVITIGRFEPSSKKCHCCGNINNELTLKDREWTCKDCGAILNRDFNAAKNILNIGLETANVK
jgi:putative transposase